MKERLMNIISKILAIISIKTSLWIVLLATLGMIGCGNNSQFSVKPIAMGRINDVVILADKETTDSPLGDTIISYFESAYPVLPAQEPIFNVRLMTPADLVAKPLKRELRTYVIIADLKDTASATTKMLQQDLGKDKWQRALTDTAFHTSVGMNKWAQGQLIIYLFGNGDEELSKVIAANFSTVARRINMHDQSNLFATVYGIRQEDKGLQKTIADNFGIDIKLPQTFNKALEKDNFLWLRMDYDGANQSIVIQKFPYKDKSQFDVSEIINLRNTYGKAYIKTGSSDAYMTTNVIDLPTLEYTYTNNGLYTKEVRGIWETENDFMGGPFVSYLMLDEAKNEVIFIDVFVFAPGKQKRDFMQQLDIIVKTVKGRK